MSNEITLDSEEISRYTRHLTLPEVGMEGQKNFKGGKVLLIGAGGLGSPMALYLAAAGVGVLGIVDDDEVDRSNLQRQIAHAESDVGKPKVDSAREAIRGINPHVEVEAHPVRLTQENASALFAQYDIIADGSDNFQTRYLINDAAYLAGKPLVSASIFRFQGQLTVFDPHNGGPCYRCLYAEPPPAALVPS